MSLAAAMVCTIALWLLPAAMGALSVMPHQSDSIVMQLRAAITLDERDLLGPLLPTACSSLDDGPFCSRFGFGAASSGDATRGLASSSGHSTGSDQIAPSFYSASDLHGGSSAQFVVDGVLSGWMQAQNREAFNWSPDTIRTFSSLVSHVISDSIGGSEDMTRSQKRLPARTGSQCFRLAFDQLLPWRARVPSDFSAGLPKAIAVTWEGLWQAEVAEGLRRGSTLVPPHAGGARTSHRSEALEVQATVRPPWATRVVLHTALGYLRFAQPLVVRRLVIGVPSSALANELWGGGGFICGRRKGHEQWRMGLEQVVASLRGTPASAAEEGVSNLTPPGILYADVGNSILAVDEVAFIATPPEGLIVALMEVMATLPSHPLHGLPAQRRVVLLRRPPRGQDSVHVEPTLATVSRDAAIWDMNEVLHHHMKIRAPAAESRGAPEQGRPAQRGLESFHEMLQGLKAGAIPPPLGVTFAQLKREVSVLVASTQQIQDQDVLRHSKIESLLQHRLHEKSLDGLVALQAAWRRRHVPEAARIATTEQPAAAPAQGEAIAPAPGGAGEAPAHRWEDAAAEAMEHASAALERKAAEVREKNKKPKAETMVFQMDPERGTIELRGVKGANALQEIARQISGGGASEASSPGGPAEEGEAAAAAAADGGEQAKDSPAETGDSEEGQAAQMSKMVAAAFKQASAGGGEGIEVVDTEGIDEEALQEALRPLMTEMKEALRAQGSDASSTQQANGEGSDPMKLQVHFVKLEDLTGGNAAEQGSVAQLLQSLVAQQQGGEVYSAGADALGSLLQAATEAQQQGANAVLGQAAGTDEGDGDPQSVDIAAL